MRLRFVAVFVAAMLGLAACTQPADSPGAMTENQVSSETPAAEPEAPAESLPRTPASLIKLDSSNMAVAACEDYEFVGGSEWLVAYELLIADMCSVGELDGSVLDLRVGENILAEPVDFYVDGILFQLSYLNQIVEGGIDPVPLVAVGEFDKEFWQENLEGLVAIEFEWYSLSDAGGHCGYRFEAEAYCNNIYIPSETKTGGSVLTLFLGSQEVLRNHDTWRISIPAHSAMHAVQYGQKMTHYTQWAIEGQALLHEMVYQQLLRGETVRFSKYFPLPFQNDGLRPDVSSIESLKAHIAACEKDGGMCLDFNSLAGSIYFEKLIHDYGIEKYKEYFSKIWAAGDMDLPIGEFEREYAPRVFVETYGFELDPWLDEVGIPYLFASFQEAGYLQ